MEKKVKTKKSVCSLKKRIKQGFSLVEVLVAIFIFSLIATMIAGSFSNFFKTYMSAKKTQRSSESAQYVMNLMAKTIRNSTINPAFVSAGSQIMMFDNFEKKCVVYKYVGSGATSKIQVAYETVPVDVTGCNPAPADSAFSDLTTAGEILNVKFVGKPSLGDGKPGKIAIVMNVQAGDASQIQTTVSLRDKDN